MTDTLNPEQLAVFESPHPDIAVLAGAGSGKTHTMVACYLAAKASPADTAIITFTNAGADEFRRRITEKGGVPPLYMGTLHGFCLRVLRTSKNHLVETVLDEAGAEALLEQVRKDMRSSVPIKTLREAIANPGTAGRNKIIVDRYLAELRRARAADYDSLLVFALEAIAARDTAYPLPKSLYVDEFQDSGRVDGKIYTALNCERLFIVGDCDQAIYGFRGGDMRQLHDIWLHLKGRGAHLLERNHRSHEEITITAQRLIEHNVDRPKKKTVSVKGPGGRVEFAGCFETDMLEYAWIAEQCRQATGTVAVLCRYNTTKRAITDYLRRVGCAVPELQPRPPADWTKALALLAAMAAPTNAMAVFNCRAAFRGREYAVEQRDRETKERKPPGFGLKDYDTRDGFIRALDRWEWSRETRAKITGAWDAHRGDIGEMILALRSFNEPPDLTTAGVRVLTMHGSKGLEFDTVIVPAMEQEALPGPRASELESERRLVYVAFTRARHTLLMSWAANRVNAYNGQAERRTVSQFIREAGF